MPKSKTMPKPLTDSAGEVRELTITELKAFQPVQSLSASLQGKLRTRGTQRAPTKERIAIRLSRDVVERFRATGDGWQTRVDAALQDWLEKHGPAA